MPTALLIANPSASQFTGGLYRQVVSALKPGFDLTTEWPISARETGITTGTAADAGVDVVFAMGGDGVAHHVANALVGSNTALGLIPSGTTNVLSRILGIPQKPLAAARAAQGDPDALSHFSAAAEALAIGVFNLAHCFSPEVVVIGGGMSQAGELLLGPVRERLERCGAACPVSRAKVVKAEGGDDVGLRGGLAYWMDTSEEGTRISARSG